LSPRAGRHFDAAVVEAFLSRWPEIAARVSHAAGEAA
jgi:response regulator RpfG family c-di-GMP phosphodiesterase